MHARGELQKHSGSKDVLDHRWELWREVECRDGCCEEGECTSTKTKKVKLGRGCEEGEWTSTKTKKAKLG